MNFLTRLKSGLAKSSGKLTEGITSIFTKEKLDDEAVERFEELLINSDMGPRLSAELASALAATRFEKGASAEAVKQWLASQLAERLRAVEKPLMLDASRKPNVILVIGVNGNGKTTTIGKLAKRYADEGKKVVIAAGDTFRAAAVEQLAEWGVRAGVPVVTGAQGADAASVVFRALEEAAGADVLFIDTAGRLHNNANLMAELAKIVQVIRKSDATAPHAVVQVLDATTGQNALAQVEQFGKAAGVTHLIVTKLDGSAKGGVVLALAKAFGLPIPYVGVGEAVEDVQIFQAIDFANNLVDLTS